jgi:hypothetical protein
VHRPHTVVGADESAEETAAEMKAHGVGFDGEMRWFVGEIAEDDQDWSFG